jgi:hypothetical protein
MIEGHFLVWGGAARTTQRARVPPTRPIFF